MEDDLKKYLSKDICDRIAESERSIASAKSSLELLPSADFDNADYKVYVHKITSPTKGVDYKYKGDLKSAIEGAINKARNTEGHDQNETYTQWDFLVFVKLGDHYFSVPNEFFEEYVKF